MKLLGLFLNVLNFCLYMIVCGIAGWAINTAIDYHIITGEGIQLANPFWTMYVPTGNSASGFFAMFAMVAGAAGVASSLSGIYYVQNQVNADAADTAWVAFVAWLLTFLAMGMAFKEMDLHGRNTHLQALEAFTVIVTVTQLVYTFAICVVAVER